MIKEKCKWFITAMFIFGMIIFACPAQAAETTDSKPIEISQSPVTSGVVIKKYIWEAREARINVIRVDLNNPFVKVEVIPAGKLTQKEKVSVLAEKTGAVAATNGDFFNTRGEPVPIGPTAVNQRLITSPSNLEGLYALGITSNKKAYIEKFTFTGSVIAPNGERYELSGLNKAPYWEETTGSHSHVNKLHLYDDMWGSVSRANDTYTTPTEMLVENGRVIEISEGEPLAMAVPEGKKILRGHGKAAEFLLKNFKPGDPIDISYNLVPSKDWSMIIGGHSLLVSAGEVIPYQRTNIDLKGQRARTAVGISKDGSQLYLVGVEGGAPGSKGLNIQDLSRFMKAIGSWKALNLDGGGSTTMVSRPLGEHNTRLVFTPEQAQERPVVNALGVFSQAPQGTLKGLVLQGNNILLVNEKTTFDVKAYDQYYNPVETGQLNINFKVTGNLGTFSNRTFFAGSPGTGKIIASAGSITETLPVKVIGKGDVASLKILADADKILEGEEIPLSVILKTDTGITKQVPSSLLEWQFYGLQGTVSPEGILKIEKTNNQKCGFVVARYQGFSAALPLELSRETMLSGLGKTAPISLSVYPEEVKGTLSAVKDPDGENYVTRLDYDFREASGTKAAYINLGQNGLSAAEKPEAILLDVYGSNGKQWLRMEIEDNTGKIHRLDLCDAINWSGWKTVSLNLSDQISFPYKLKHFYVVSLENDSDRAQHGSLLFKDLRLKHKAGEVSVPGVVIELKAGEKEFKINDSSQNMDVAPFISEGRVLVPVRFISEALNANVLWEGSTKNVTVIKERDWIDLWPEERMMVVNGKSFSLDQPPRIYQGRTMLPLRAVAEALDLKVQWDPVTRKITCIN